MLMHLVNGFFRLCSVVFLLVACSSFAQSVPQAISGSEVEETLIGTAWSGTAFGEPFDIYFLDNHAMVYRTNNGNSTKGRWFFPANAISIDVIEERQLKQKFEGTVRGNQIVGKATEIKKIIGLKIEDAAESPWILNKLDKPIPALLAAAPPGRPAPPLPTVTAGDFAGTFSNNFPSFVGRNDGASEFRVRCDSGGICSLKAGAGPIEVYDYLKTVRRSELAEAGFALKYAKEHKAQAIRTEPWLAPLLNSNASISTCLDLRKKTAAFVGGDVPGYMLLCTLDVNPWKSPVVLLMGTILANCGPAFCRFAIMPLFKQDTAADAPPAATGELRIKPGASISQIQGILQTKLEPSPYGRGGYALRLEDEGIWTFFDSSEKATTIRLDAPFRGTVLGIRIGETLERLQAKFGKAAMMPFSYGSNKAYIYQLDPAYSMRFDINASGLVETIFLILRATSAGGGN